MSEKSVTQQDPKGKGPKREASVGCGLTDPYMLIWYPGGRGRRRAGYESRGRWSIYRRVDGQRRLVGYAADFLSAWRAVDRGALRP